MTYRQIITGDTKIDKAIGAIYEILNRHNDALIEIKKTFKDKNITDEERFNLIQEKLDEAIQIIW